MFDVGVYGFSPAPPAVGVDPPTAAVARAGADRTGADRAGADRIDTIVAHERQVARLQAEQAEQMAAHAAAVAPGGGLRGAAAEVALARGVSPMAAEHQLHTAQVLVADLPGLFDLLHRGEISWAGASAVVRETGVATAEVRRRIDARLAATVEKGTAARIPIGEPGPPAADGWPDDGWLDDGWLDDGWLDDTGGSTGGAGGSEPTVIAEVVRGIPQLTVLPDIRPVAATPARLGAAARRLVALLDPDAAAARTTAAVDNRRVDIVAAPDGPGDVGAALVARLPAEQAAACWHALDHHARSRRADGDPRSICQLMADTLVERVTGHGPLDAGTARSTATAATATWRRVIVDDDGHVTTTDRHTRRPDTDPGTGTDIRTWLHRPIDSSIHDIDTTHRFYTGTLRTYITTCRMPVCPTTITDIDHITPHTHHGHTTTSNGHGLSRGCHHLRDLPGWHLTASTDTTTHTLTWTTPTGHHYHSRPPRALGWGSEPP